MISALSVSVIPHLVHPRKAVDLPERIPPSASGIWGGCIGQVSTPPNSIGTAVEPQVVIECTNRMGAEPPTGETAGPTITETTQRPPRRIGHLESFCLVK